MDTISQNKNTVTSFIDALFTKGDLGAVDEYLAEEYVDHDPPMGGPAGREGMRQAGAVFRAAFPDSLARTTPALTAGAVTNETRYGRSSRRSSSSRNTGTSGE